MNRYLSIVVVIVGVVACTGCSSADKTGSGKEPSRLSGDYLGQTPARSTPELFAPGVVSTGLYERDVAMTPDGNELYFGLITGDDVAIVGTKRENGVWTKPEIAPFCDDPAVFNLEPHITPDGKRFLFLSTRPQEGQEKKPGWVYQDIWAMDRNADGWGKPYNLGEPVNTDAPEYYPSCTKDGTLYFTREVTENGRSRSLIHRSRMNYLVHSEGGSYAVPKILPAAVNPGDAQFNAFIDPDERYLIVSIANYKDNIGRCDYYVCFRSDDDVWTGPINMGELINTPGNNVASPCVSPDGRYFFFASNRRKQPATPAQPGTAGQPSTAGQSGVRGPSANAEPARTYESIQQMATKPQNGNSDIYWVDASFIETLRPKPGPSSEP